MAVGKIGRAVLGDIANAIRKKSGTSTRFKPKEMGDAVAALDGTDAGACAQYTDAGDGTGVVSPGVFTAIADALRGHTGGEETYKPGEMAAAILALTWQAAETKLRALLLDDGTLEFNCLDGVRTTLAGRTVVSSYEPSLTAYADSEGRPWDAAKLEIKKVVFDSSVAGCGIEACDYWFQGCLNLTEVSGFENLQGITSANYMFNSCVALESVFAASFDNSSLTGTYMFYGCKHLVGGGGFVPTGRYDATACALGSDGVLTDPASDAREWVRVRLYEDGRALFTSMDAAGYEGEPVVDGRVCAGGLYNTAEALPCYEKKAQVTKVVFGTGMDGFSEVRMSYWFNSYSALAEIAGWSNLKNVRALNYTMQSCRALTSLDMRGFDASGVELMSYCFASCSKLAVIYVSPGFADPGLSSFMCFYNCRALVGGNGTAWSSSNTDASYFRIDTADAPGYLTALAD